MKTPEEIIDFKLSMPVMRQVIIEAMQEYARIAIKETIETAKHHVDGDFDAEGTMVNTLKQLGL